MFGKRKKKDPGPIVVRCETGVNQAAEVIYVDTMLAAGSEVNKPEGHAFNSSTQSLVFYSSSRAAPTNNIPPRLVLNIESIMFKKYVHGARAVGGNVNRLME
ncbi:unnamed protein product [Caenorhabditis sp. 36 PRJEB53466]|nr:unnamed protein product [Caenorhabditis sp. 36 PRJEB53466]